MGIETMNHEFAEKLRQLSAQHLPAQMQTVDGQRRLMQMLCAIVPPVSVCINKAEREYWPQVEQEQLPMDKAIRKVSYDVNSLIRITVVKNLMLDSLPLEALLKAWAALDQYCLELGDKASPQTVAFQNSLAAALKDKLALQEKAVGMAAKLAAMERESQEEPEQIGQTVPVQLLEDMPEQMSLVQSSANQQMEPVRQGTVITAPQSEWTYSPEEAPKKKMRWWIPLIPVAVVILVLILYPILNPAMAVESDIKKIGEVTLDSEEAILEAEQSYAELTEAQQEKVDNYDILVEARQTYDCLATAEAIDAIGNVSMTSKEALEKAEQMYEALSSEQKFQVKNSKILTAARREFDRLNEALQAASDAIDAIGTVTLESGEKIQAARDAYDALAQDQLQPYLLEKFKVLDAAESSYRNLVSEDLYTTAMELFEKGKYESALENFQAIATDYAGTDAASRSDKSMADCTLKLAEEAYGKKDCYTAMNLLESIDAKYNTSEEYTALMNKIIKKLEKDHPKNGKMFTDKIGWGWGGVKVTAGDEDICVRIVNKKDHSKYMMFFVRAGSYKKVNVKNGDYTIYYSTGKYWYNKTVGFGDEAKYHVATRDLSLTSWREGSYVYYYEPTMNLKNTSSSYFSFVSSNADAFWG